MFQVFSQAKGHKPVLWAAVDKENQPLALFTPVQVSVLPGLLERSTTRSVAYGSVLCRPGSEGETALDAVLNKYKRKTGNRILFTELRNLSDLSPLQPVLRKAGFFNEESINYLIDLNCSKRALMQSFGKRTRKHIRRALRNERLAVEEVTRKDQIKDCYDLLKKSYFRARVFLPHISLFEAAFDILYPKRMVRFLLAQVDGLNMATSVELLYKGTIYGWFGGMDRKFSKFTPNELLTWHIFDWGIDNGYKLYDFGGAGNPEKKYSVRDFKAKFKGKLVSFGRSICVHSPSLLRISKLGYPIYETLLSLMHKISESHFITYKNQ
jgi:hypothetical protein